MSLHIDLINRGTVGELVLSGRLDNSTAVEAEKIIDSTAQRYTDLVLDMKALEYISSAGLRILKRTYMTMRRKEGTLSLKNVNKMVLEVLEVTGFAGILRITSVLSERGDSYEYSDRTCRYEASATGD